MDTSLRTAAAVALGAGRVAVGATALAAPGRMARAWAGLDPARTPTARMVATSLGIRDLVLGIGLLRALRRDQDAREWLCYGAAADAVDAAGVLRNLGNLPPAGKLALPLAAGAAALGVALAGSTK